MPNFLKLLYHKNFKKDLMKLIFLFLNQRNHGPNTVVFKTVDDVGILISENRWNDIGFMLMWCFFTNKENTITIRFSD